VDEVFIKKPRKKNFFERGIAGLGVRNLITFGLAGKLTDSWDHLVS
jgi:hypothetical protein